MKINLQFFNSLIKNRLFIFCTFFLAFFIIQFSFNKDLLPSTETKDIWFYSGLFMVIFSILYIEPYYSSPKNVITNVIPLFLVLLAIKETFSNEYIWWGFLTFLALLIIFSILAMSLQDSDKSQNYWTNRFSETVKKIVVIIGKGKFVYSVFFLYFLLTNNPITSLYTISLLIIWSLILLIDPKEIITKFSISPTQENDTIGEIFGVISKNEFLVKIYKDQIGIEKFDIVRFRYSIQNNPKTICNGIIFDTYSLNDGKWAKILQLSTEEVDGINLENNCVSLVKDVQEIEALSSKLKINRIVGTIIDGSKISKIIFEYSKKLDDIQEGDLVELWVNGKRLFYQVVNGFTFEEKLEGDNRKGFIKGEAIQLGEWINEEMSFQKFGWVPNINTPIYKADTNDIVIPKIEYPNYQLGVIPGTTLPSIMNLDDAISHHTAILGITGSGKSYISREIINQIKNDTKVICVDFNKEFVSTLIPKPDNIIQAEKEQLITQNIDRLLFNQERFQKDRVESAISNGWLKTIKDEFRSEILKYISDNNHQIKIFELPDVINSTGILEYTKFFFRSLFEIAKEKQFENNSKKICVVLEEAHTIIPEWNFLGSSDKTSQSVTNAIAQIALQGRKYGVGFLVIAQRTANVSKTVLTQCNSVICFQAFDDTSFNFLSNYLGNDTIQALPNLKKFHAVVAGKALKSNIPMIVDFTRN